MTYMLTNYIKHAMVPVFSVWALYFIYVCFTVIERLCGMYVVIHGYPLPGPRLSMNTILPRYADSHVKDKTVMRPSYL